MISFLFLNRAGRAVFSTGVIFSCFLARLFSFPHKADIAPNGLAQGEVPAYRMPAACLVKLGFGSLTKQAAGIPLIGAGIWSESGRRNPAAWFPSRQIS
jgi:hypothetical protein